MDLETKDINGKLTPYCVSIFDGKLSKSFYITDYKSYVEMLRDSVLYILKRKYNKNRVYLHNFSHFDGIFLMKEIISITGSDQVKPVIRDNRIINLRVEFYQDNKTLINNKKFKNKIYYVEFRDSYLLLTTSLENLGKTFATNKGRLEQKLSFPYKFVNEPWVKYDYVGETPDLKYFDNISSYKTFLNNLEVENMSNWDLKKETIKYCEQDCKTLYYAIKEFSKLIYLQFGVDISKTPTISSLAFRIFRVSFLQTDKKIPILNDIIYEFIYQGYYGGHVDAYIPSGKNIKGYDVNALYPTSMLKNKMPVGNPYYFEGDLNYFNEINFNYPLDNILNGDPENNLKPKTIFSYLNEIFNIENKFLFETEINKFLNLDNKNNVLCNDNNLPYGFFDVDLETPHKDEWNEPILLKKHKSNNGLTRTIAPVGKWKGVYFSDELYNAIEKNPKHKFKTHRGFLFIILFLIIY